MSTKTDARPGETLLPAAADMAGISYRTIDYWVRQSYVTIRADGSRTASTAGYPGAPGSGRSRYLNPTELHHLLQMARLVRAGITPAYAATVARRLTVTAVTQSVTLGPGIALVIRPEAAVSLPAPTHDSRKARLLRWLRPGWGWCLRCGMPWSDREEHTVPTGPHTGAFALCEPCWARLGPLDRLPYYEALVFREGPGR